MKSRSCATIDFWRVHLKYKKALFMSRMSHWTIQKIVSLKKTLTTCKNSQKSRRNNKCWCVFLIQTFSTGTLIFSNVSNTHTSAQNTKCSKTEQYQIFFGKNCINFVCKACKQVKNDPNNSKLSIFWKEIRQSDISFLNQLSNFQ